MITVRMENGAVVVVLPGGSARPLAPEVDWARVAATTESEIAAPIADDEAEAMREAAAYNARQRDRDLLRRR